jgi:hypothetical protein
MDTSSLPFQEYDKIIFLLLGDHYKSHSIWGRSAMQLFGGLQHVIGHVKTKYA